MPALPQHRHSDMLYKRYRLCINSYCVDLGQSNLAFTIPCSPEPGGLLMMDRRMENKRT